MTLFLIAHKVRGAPAFDIAERWPEGTPSDPGPWWIVPTSGRRAYPWAASEIVDVTAEMPPMPDGLPDHYEPQGPSGPKIESINLEDLL
jgi:hypothetical protein